MEVIVYAVCFSVGLLFALISAFMGHVFGGGDAHVDIGTGGHAEAGFQDTGMPGLSPFSPTTLASFITAFGGFGLIFSKIEATKSPWLSAPLALVCAVAVAAGVMFLFAFIFHKTQSSSEVRIGNMVGMTATVITPIPADGVGEIAYVQGGSRSTAPARCELNEVIGSGRTVKVVRIVGSQFYVQPV